MGDTQVPTDVYGIFRFLDPDLSVPASERPMFVGPTPKRVVEERIKLIDFRNSHDIEKGAKGLDVQSFTFVNHKFSLHANQILEGTNAEDIYAQEVIDFMLKLTGASRAVVHNITFRRKTAESQDQTLDPKQYAVQRRGGERLRQVGSQPRNGILVNRKGDYTDEPIRHAHCDITLDSARGALRYCRKIVKEAAMPVLELEDARSEGAAVKIPRYAAYSVWRPLKTVKRDPIAVLDYRSIDKTEMVVTDFRVPSEVAESGEHVSSGWLHTPPKKPEALEWYWVPEQKPDEVCIIKFSDSACEDDPNIAASCFHCSPVVLGTQCEQPRESVEARIYCFWE
ncbi:Putative hydroxylase/desaturase AsaB [Septoria linicola]|uniref:Hydroxylase/desaturase AsaB n=1 Tax=Septoria linicola TaxID=215465 RepID=A0A9Q9ERC8_9PEZI|nr:Putative hydroxylase/desaturase AsaB [Septoria linicola]